MVTVVQLVRASDCGSECRGFESHQSPLRNPHKSRTYEDLLYNKLNHIFKDHRKNKSVIFA